ncbi:DUF4870 domain-containing protein [Virgibacillus halophilus]|uniref:DUF4870 domain-containing protein n=1 Tax=Tigheibacillus halophilus TaxID=361280 RepID=A0ABU5C905_9BACI|nr:DUF4870 domain-containing protein [Virgibacillus halophilus]
MKADKILSSLCYFSVLFAPFLFPIIMYILASGDVRSHAGKALWTHLVPYLALFFCLGALVLNTRVSTGNGTIAWIIIGVGVAIGVYYFILNYVRGIKLLLEA